ncbi:MAG: hypothetical protein M3Q08_12945, partial [Pseudomonadota bacterium]|nr:hypothetical protein [Pseudomonadota bacterium]
MLFQDAFTTFADRVAALPDAFRTQVTEAVAADPKLQARTKIVDVLHDPNVGAPLLKEAAMGSSGRNSAGKPRKRAYTAIVTAPGHMIGDKAQVEGFRKGKTPELPPWYGEWADLLPHWKLDILETPYDVEAFFRGAKRDPHTPRVGFIANTKLSLSCGKSVGGEVRTSPFAQLRAATMLDAVEREGNALKDLRKKRKAEAQVETAVAASDDEQSTEEQQQQYPRGVSVRTKRRDALLRQIAKDGSAQPLVREGVCCPTCGRRHLTRSLLPSTPASLRKDGLAKVFCEYCATALGQDTREQDSVLDRKIPLFRSEAWLARAEQQERVVVATRFEACETASAGDPCRWFGNRKALVEAYPLTKIEVIGTEPVLDAAGQPVLYRDSEGHPVLQRNERTGELILDVSGQPQPVVVVRELRREVPLLDDHGQQRYGLRPVRSQQTTTEEPIPWGERPRSNPRVALGVLIGRRHRGEVDIYLADEVHDFKGATTAMGRAFGLMFTAARRTVGLTGTLYGGYASDIYYLLLRCGNKAVRE